MSVSFFWSGANRKTDSQVPTILPKSEAGREPQFPCFKISQMGFLTSLWFEKHQGRGWKGIGSMFCGVGHGLPFHFREYHFKSCFSKSSLSVHAICSSGECVDIYACVYACDVWRSEDNCGCLSSDTTHLFFLTGSHIGQNLLTRLIWLASDP